METLYLALRVVVSLAAVLGVIWFAQRRIGRGKLLTKVVREIQIVGRQSLGSKASVVLIESGGVRLMLGVTDHSVTVLHQSPVVQSPAESPSAAESPEERSPAEPSPEAQTAPMVLGSGFSGHLVEAEAQLWKRPRSTFHRGQHK